MLPSFLKTWYAPDHEEVTVEHQHRGEQRTLNNYHNKPPPPPESTVSVTSSEISPEGGVIRFQSSSDVESGTSVCMFTKEVFWEIHNFAWEQRMYESFVFSFGDYCWRLNFGYSDENDVKSGYGFYLRILQGEEEKSRLDVNVEFKMHNQYVAPLIRSRPQPYSFGEGSTHEQRGMYRFASKDMVAAYLIRSPSSPRLRLSVRLQMSRSVHTLAAPLSSAAGSLMRSGGGSTTSSITQKQNIQETKQFSSPRSIISIPSVIMEEEESKDHHTHYRHTSKVRSSSSSRGRTTSEGATTQASSSSSGPSVLLLKTYPVVTQQRPREKTNTVLVPTTYSRRSAKSAPRNSKVEVSSPPSVYTTFSTDRHTNSSPEDSDSFEYQYYVKTPTPSPSRFISSMSSIASSSVNSCQSRSFSISTPNGRMIQKLITTSPQPQRNLHTPRHAYRANLKCTV